MKKGFLLIGILLSVIVIAAFSIVGYSVYNKSTLEPDLSQRETILEDTKYIEGWKLYRSEIFGYEIKYPPDFQVRPAYQNKVSVDESKPFLKTFPDCFTRKDAVSGAVSHVCIRIDEVKLPLKLWLSLQNTTYTWEHAGEIKVDGAEANVYENKNTKERYTIFEGEKGIYIFSSINFEDNQMLNTFRFID